MSDSVAANFDADKTALIQKFEKKVERPIFCLCSGLGIATASLIAGMCEIIHPYGLGFLYIPLTAAGLGVGTVVGIRPGYKSPSAAMRVVNKEIAEAQITTLSEAMQAYRKVRASLRAERRASRHAMLSA